MGTKVIKVLESGEIVIYGLEFRNVCSSANIPIL